VASPEREKDEIKAHRQTTNVTNFAEHCQTTNVTNLAEQKRVPETRYEKHASVK
jgi:hypothetical protein